MSHWKDELGLITSCAARLAGANSCSEVGDVLVAAALDLGATAAAMALVEGSDLVLLRSSGYAAEEIALLARRPFTRANGVLLADGDQPVGALDFLLADEEEAGERARSAFACLAGIAGAAIGRARRSETLEDRFRRGQRLLGVVCHDLRTPLCNILLAAEVMARGQNLDSRDRRLLGRLQSSAHLARRLVLDLLDQTRVELLGHLPVERQPGDLFAAVHQVTADARTRDPSRTIVLTTDGHGDGHWDLDRAVQILENLVSNALIHSPPDFPIEIIAEGRRADRVYVEVRSYGSSIPPDQIGQLFEPLEQGEGRGRGQRGSLGLGLFIVRQLVGGHGGRVWVTSSPAEGTAFVVEMPRAQGASVIWQGDGDVSDRLPAPSPPREPVAPSDVVPAQYQALMARFSDPAVGRLLRHWLDLGGAAQLPHPGRIDRVQLGYLLPEMFFARAVAAKDGSTEFRFQEVGGSHERWLGCGLAGTVVPSAVVGGPSRGNGHYDAYGRCAELRRPIYDFARVALDGQRPTTLERLTLPLSRDGGRSVTDLVGVVRIGNLPVERRASVTGEVRP